MASAELQHISIIIPVLNEEGCLGVLLPHISKHSAMQGALEVLVVDGGSTDRTVAVAKAHGAKVVLGEKGRAKQMNLGAQKATGNILYFLHVDTLPPPHFDAQIVKAVQGGHQAGCFRMKFDDDSPFLRFFGWCTRINLLICRGGDQSLFICRALFTELGGFDAAYTVYEDNEFIGRVYQRVPFKIVPSTVTTSARRYRKKGVIRLQFHFGIIHLKHFLGYPPQALYGHYSKYCALN